MMDLKQINDALNQYVRPQTFPVAIRMCTSEEELPEKVRLPIQDLGINISLCHAIAMARRYGWTVAVDKYQTCYAAGISMGFLPLLPDVVDGSFQESVGLWGMSKEQAAEAPTRRRGQAYVVNQLRALLRGSKEAAERETIITLERAINSESLPPPVHTELNRLRKNKVSGADLLGKLTELYRAFGLGAYLDQQTEEGDRGEQPFPRIVCSEALV